MTPPCTQKGKERKVKEKKEAPPCTQKGEEKRLKEKESLEAKEKNRDEERKLRDFKFEVIPVSETEEPETVEEEDKDEVVVPDFILHEALMVLRDYISFHGHRVAEAAKPGGKESL